jgi:sensor histidine kinase regulating citrate/malate metabolism
MAGLLHCGNLLVTRVHGGTMKLPLWHHVRQRLSTQVVLLMVAILVITLAGGYYVVQTNLHGRLNDQFEHRALSVAQTLAAEEYVAKQVADGRPGGQLQVLAFEVREQTGALFVVLANAQGIRYTHPNPALIGTSITYQDPEPVTSEPFRTGHAWLGIQRGSLGWVAALLQEREAMLHGIREAVLGYDTGGRVLLANDAARDLLALPAEFAGHRPALPQPPARDRPGRHQAPLR